MYKAGVKSMGIYSIEGFSAEIMLASDPAGSMGNEHTEGNGEQFPDDAMRLAEGAHRPTTNLGIHLAVRHRDWAPDGIGEAVYMYTLDNEMEWGWLHGKKDQ